MDYTQLQSALAANIKAQTIAERDYREAQAEADKWSKRYQLALREGRKDLIQEAEFRKNIYTKKVCNLKALLDEQTERVATLRRSLTAQIKIFANSFTTNSSFNSLEEKLQQIEARFQATVELPGNDLKTRLRQVESELESMKSQLLNQQTSISKLLQQNLNVLEEVRILLKKAYFYENFELSSTEQITQFANFEFDSDVDDELAELANILLISYPNTSQAQNQNLLPTADTVQIVDAELEQLRSQLDNL